MPVRVSAVALPRGLLRFPSRSRNSTIVALATTVLSLLVGIFAAYAIVRLNLGKNLIARGLIFSYLVPRAPIHPALRADLQGRPAQYAGGPDPSLSHVHRALHHLACNQVFSDGAGRWRRRPWSMAAPGSCQDGPCPSRCRPSSSPRSFPSPLWNEFPVCADLTSNPVSGPVTVGLTSTVAEEALLGGDDGRLLSHRHSPGCVVPAGAALMRGLTAGSGEGIAARSRNGQKRRSQRTRGKRRRVRQRQAT